MLIINSIGGILTDNKDYWITDTDDCTSELVTLDDIRKAYWYGIKFEGLTVKHTRNGFSFRSDSVCSSFTDKVVSFGGDNNFIYTKKGYKYLGTTLVDCLGVYFCNYFYMLDVTSVIAFRFITPNELLLKVNLMTYEKGASFANYNSRTLVLDNSGIVKIRGLESIRGKLCSLSEAKRIMIGALL